MKTASLLTIMLLIPITVFAECSVEVIDGVSNINCDGGNIPVRPRPAPAYTPACPTPSDDKLTSVLTTYAEKSTLSMYNYKYPMHSIMVACKDITNEAACYIDCIVNTYSGKGRNHNSQAHKAFIMNINEISSAYQQGKLTDAQANMAVHNAYNDTIAIESRDRNNRNQPLNYNTFR